jgi:hypothetical protein
MPMSLSIKYASFKKMMALFQVDYKSYSAQDSSRYIRKCQLKRFHSHSHISIATISLDLSSATLELEI